MDNCKYNIGDKVWVWFDPKWINTPGDLVFQIVIRSIYYNMFLKNYKDILFNVKHYKSKGLKLKDYKYY